MMDQTRCGHRVFPSVKAAQDWDLNGQIDMRVQEKEHRLERGSLNHALPAAFYPILEYDEVGILYR